MSIDDLFYGNVSFLEILRSALYPTPFGVFPSAIPYIDCDLLDYLRGFADFTTVAASSASTAPSFSLMYPVVWMVWRGDPCCESFSDFLGDRGEIVLRLAFDIFLSLLRLEFNDSKLVCEA